MHPILISIGNFSVSSFGAFLGLGFLAGLFISWRLSRVYDIDEEKTLDVSLLTFFGGLIGARILFVLENLNLFDSLTKVVLINRFPGLTFYGGLAAGALVLYLLCRKFKLSFLQMADFLVVGLFAGLSLGSIGCLLGSCHPGVVSNFLAVPQAGLIGQRFPLQFIEALIYLIVFINLWRICLRFHWSGKVLSIGLFLLGLINFLSENFRGDSPLQLFGFSLSRLLSLLILILGGYIFYKAGGRSLSQDLVCTLRTVRSERERARWVLKVKRQWYNLGVNWRVKSNKSLKAWTTWLKRLLRKSNVKLNPPEF